VIRKSITRTESRKGRKMPTKETHQLAPQEAPAVERYIPREWTTDPDFSVSADRHEGQRDWFSRMLGWLAAR
jgi:hypothetical protein